jgi:hypothetical protein
MYILLLQDISKACSRATIELIIRSSRVIVKASGFNPKKSTKRNSFIQVDQRPASEPALILCVDSYCEMFLKGNFLFGIQRSHPGNLDP